MNDKAFDPTINLFNPANKDPDQLLAEFIDRKDLLKRILDIIRHNSPDRPQQHVILIGPRGMGKTTLLCAIKYRVLNDAELNAEWLPILFSEEQYNIGDLADFWLECLRHLEAALNRRPQSAEALLNKEPDNLDELAQDEFFRMLADSGKRAILLVDNLNDLFRDIDDGNALNQLRALWMTDPRMTVIGASASYFEQITAVDQAFHDFFRTFSLDRLNREELETFIRRLAEYHSDDSVIQTIECQPQRLDALRILSGGNPRLVMYGYRMLRDGIDGDARHDLERLLNECTPFFKHRIDGLKAKELRRTFDAIARRWDPVTVDDIRKELRKPSNYVSAQIRRLIDEGFVEEAGGDKKKRYQVSERFYNVYYLMRYSREGRRRLQWLACFMQTFYSRREFKEWAKRLENELQATQTELHRSDKMSYLHALSAAAGSGSDGRSKVFETIIRDAIAHNDRSELDADCADGDPVESHGWRYIAAEILWLLPSAIRQTIGFKPSYGESWWRRLRESIEKGGLTEQCDIRLAELGAMNTDTANHANAAGVILNNYFYQHAEAEAVYRMAIELDPDYAYASASAWNNLGISLFEQNRYPEAKAACRKAIELDPDFAEAWINLSISLHNQKRHPEAEAALRKAIELDPDHASAWNNLGSSLHEQNRYPEAEVAFRKSVELDPDYALTWSNLSILYLLRLKQREAGISALLTALSIAPEDDSSRYLLNQFWQEVLPEAVKKIIANEKDSDNLPQAITDMLLIKASGKDRNAVRDALQQLDETEQQLFEPLLLALQAIDDRSVLYRIAREKREVVLDVMQQIAPEAMSEDG